MTSAAYDSPHVVWVAAGGGWAGDSVSCPRSGEIIVREQTHWYSTGTRFQAAQTPHWWFDDTHIHGPDGLSLPMTLALPGAVNRGNATQAVAAAVTLGADPAAAVAAVSLVSTRWQAGTGPCRWARTPRGCCWPRTRPAGRRRCRWWTRDAAGVVIAVNGQVPDGEDLSWLWDVRVRAFRDGARGGGRRAWHRPRGAAGLRGRRAHTGARHRCAPSTSCPPGHVEVIANYTAFLQLNRTSGARSWLSRRCGSGWCCPT